MKFKSSNSLHLFILAFFMNQVYAQDLAHHQWQNRLLIIKLNTAKLQLYQQQLNELMGNLAGLKERKLILYHVKDYQYCKGLKKRTTWQALKDGALKQVCKSKFDFEVILIGLDGGVKLRQARVLKVAKLFAVIDAMPLRKGELERK